MGSEFCPQCGTARTGAFRFCRSCQFDFDGIPPVGSVPVADPVTLSPTPTVAVPSSNPAAMAAGVAWILTAAVTAYLALLQWSYAGTPVDDGSYQLSALWNGVAAALTAYFGARCLTNPPRGFLGTSTAWGALSVAWGAYQIANGATHELILLGVLGAGVAGILSLAARPAAPAQKPPPKTT